jgi:hypothetical protein
MIQLRNLLAGGHNATSKRLSFRLLGQTRTRNTFIVQGTLLRTSRTQKILLAIT